MRTSYPSPLPPSMLRFTGFQSYSYTEQRKVETDVDRMTGIELATFQLRRPRTNRLSYVCFSFWGLPLNLSGNYAFVLELENCFYESRLIGGEDVQESGKTNSRNCLNVSLTDTSCATKNFARQQNIRSTSKTTTLAAAATAATKTSNKTKAKGAVYNASWLKKIYSTIVKIKGKLNVLNA